MRTTIDIPDALGRQAKSRASLAGVSFKRFVREALERQLAAGLACEPAATDRSLPIIRSRKPGGLVLSPDEISAILVREEAAAYGADLRR